jgi:hypothetical protein
MYGLTCNTIQVNHFCIFFSITEIFDQFENCFNISGKLYENCFNVSCKLYENCFNVSCKLYKNCFNVSC